MFMRKKNSTLKETADILKQETQLLIDLESQARQVLDQSPEVQTIVFGHTHKAMNKIYPDGKQYINTGTWTKMIYLDWRSLGQNFSLTFAHIRLLEGKSECNLREWVGVYRPHRFFRG